jgi:hypothetical protein
MLKGVILNGINLYSWSFYWLKIEENFNFFRLFPTLDE